MAKLILSFNISVRSATKAFCQRKQGNTPLNQINIWGNIIGIIPEGSLSKYLWTQGKRIAISKQASRAWEFKLPFLGLTIHFAKSPDYTVASVKE